MKTLLERINMILHEVDYTINENDDYEEFFRSKLKEWGIKDPEELSDKDKKKFFREIEMEWKRDK